MDESVVKHLEQRTLKMSEAIRIGAAMVEENHGSYCGCALGTAYRGLTGRDLSTYMRDASIGAHAQHVAALFGIPLGIAVEAERKHLYSQGAMPRLQIADWLESEGY